MPGTYFIEGVENGWTRLDGAVVANGASKFVTRLDVTSDHHGRQVFVTNGHHGTQPLAERMRIGICTMGCVTLFCCLKHWDEEHERQKHGDEELCARTFPPLYVPAAAAKSPYVPAASEPSPAAALHDASGSTCTTRATASAASSDLWSAASTFSD